MSREDAEAYLTQAGQCVDGDFPLLEAAIACALHEDPSRDAQQARDLGESGIEHLTHRLATESPEEADSDAQWSPDGESLAFRRRVGPPRGEKFNADSKGPGVHTQYDAVMVIGLAMNIAKEMTGPAIKEAVRKVHTPGGVPVGTGPAEYKKALELIKAGKPIKYFGATGPLEFDANGDVTGPALVWKIKDGKLETDRVISIEEMQALFKKVEG